MRVKFKISPGIYAVTGDYIPIQVIESKKLPPDENVWLNSLKRNLKGRVYDGIMAETAHRKHRLPSGAYLAALALANPELFVEEGIMATKTRKKKRSFEEIFTEAGIIPEWIARGEAKGITQGEANARQYFLELLNQGLSVEELKQKLANEQ